VLNVESDPVDKPLDETDLQHLTLLSNHISIAIWNARPYDLAQRELAERKTAEEALPESEEKYKTLTNNLNVGVYRVSPGAKGRFLEANPAYLKIYGYESREQLFK